MAVKLLEHGEDEDGVAVVVDKGVFEVDDVGDVDEAVQELELLLSETSDGDGLECQGHEIGDADSELDGRQVMLVEKRAGNSNKKEGEG